MRILSQIVLALALTAGSIYAYASDYKVGSVMAKHAWARVTIADRPAAGYMSVHNMGGDADRLVSASSPMAERVELHTHIMQDNIMKMRRVDAFDVPAGGTTELAPGGNHLMIFGLKHLPKPGDMIPLTVVFEKAGSVDMQLEVRKAGHKMKDDDHSGHSEDGDDTKHDSHSD